MSPTPSRASLLAIALSTCAALAAQVVLTRLFSATLAYHFSFLAVSLAMLGTGAGALILYLRPRWFPGSAERELARWSIVLCGSLVLLPLVMVRLDFSGMNELTPEFALNLAIGCIVAAVPPLAAGVVVALAIDRYRSVIGVVYAVDLLGAGIGALLVVPVMWLIPAPALMTVLAVMAAVSGWLFASSARDAGRTRITSAAVGAAAAGVLALASATPILSLDAFHGTKPDAVLLAERWTPISHVTAYRAASGGPFAGLFYDRIWAPIVIVEPGEVPDWKKTHSGPASIGYQLTGPGHTLVVGGGGGRDIWAALSEQQYPVDVIELSEGNRLVVDEDVREISGGPYSADGVATTIGDGRSVLSASDERYDTIHIGFTDTLSASAAQGYALTENNLYTVEAYLEYFEHLEADGVLSVSRALQLVGDEALRATVLALASLEAWGVENPKDHVIVVLGRDLLGPEVGIVLTKLSPFTAEQVELARQLVETRATRLLFAPGGPYDGPWADLAASDSVQEFCRSYPLNVCPPTDDQPFFFSMQRLQSMGRRMDGYIYTTDPVSVLFLTLVILAALSAVAFVLPVWSVKVDSPPTPAALSYFAAIGVGFMLFEMVLIQRLVLFLGYPTYALSIVLFALLVFSGAGSYLTARLDRERVVLERALLGVSLLIAASAFGLYPMLQALMDLPFVVRAMVAVLVIVPFGLGLGMAMPIGLTRFSRMFPTGVAYAWAVNGITSVLASVLGIAIAIFFGYRVLTLVCAALYMGAYLHAKLGAWDGPVAAPDA